MEMKNYSTKTTLIHLIKQSHAKNTFSMDIALMGIDANIYTMISKIVLNSTTFY